MKQFFLFLVLFLFGFFNISFGLNKSISFNENEFFNKNKSFNEDISFSESFNKKINPNKKMNPNKKPNKKIKLSNIENCENLNISSKFEGDIEYIKEYIKIKNNKYIKHKEKEERINKFKKELQKEKIKKEIFIFHNKIRKENGIKELIKNDKLYCSAQKYSNFMERSSKFGHLVDGSNPLNRVKTEGGKFFIVAENLAYFQGNNLNLIFSEWMNSFSHRKTILNSKLKYIGIGYKKGYYVVNFGG